MSNVGEGRLAKRRRSAPSSLRARIRQVRTLVKGSPRSPLGLRSATLTSPVESWHVPQGLVYAVIVAAVAAWSWDRWQSGYSTAIAALSASACVLVVEIALSAASPWAGRALLGLREGGVGNPSSSAVPPSGMEPSDAGRGKEAAASRAAGPSRDEIERKLNDAEMRLQQAAARLESTHERIDELEQERTSMLGETVLARRALLQLIGTSLDGLAAVELEEVRQALAAAAQARGPLDAERPAGTPDTQPFAGSTPTRVSTVEKVIFAISSAAATVMVVLFVVVLWFA